MSDSRELVVVYDGDCALCTRLSHRLRRWDRASSLEILPSTAAGVRERFPGITAHDYQRALQVVGRDGRRWQGASAVEEILRVLPKGRWVAWIFHVPGMRPLAERAYAWIARNRHRLGCGTHCSLRGD